MYNAESLSSNLPDRQGGIKKRSRDAEERIASTEEIGEGKDRDASSSRQR